MLTFDLVLILNVGKYAPRFKMGFTVMSVLSVCEFAMIFVIKYFVDRDRKRNTTAESGIGQRELEDDAQAIAAEK
jgi:MFS transporter, ACS family, pantothenate transporter